MSKFDFISYEINNGVEVDYLAENVGFRFFKREEFFHILHFIVDGYKNNEKIEWFGKRDELYVLYPSEELMTLKFDFRLEKREIKFLFGILRNCPNIISIDIGRHIHLDNSNFKLFMSLLGSNSTLNELIIGEGITLFNGKDDNYEKVESLHDALVLNSSLTSLKINDVELDQQCCISLSDAFSKNSSLTSIQLFHCRIDDLGCTALSECLKSNTSITSLNLAYNRINNAGCIALCDRLLTNSSITSLNLSNNEFSSTSIFKLNKVLKRNTSLIDLNLSGNREIGVNGIKSLLTVMSSNTSIVSLNICRIRGEYHWLTDLEALLEKNITLTSVKYG